MALAMPDLIIIGAGIIGCALAEQFARRGKRVLVLDAQDLASQSSAAGMGHLVVLGDDADQFALAAYSQKLWQARRAQLPENVEYRNSGTLWVASNEAEREAAHSQLQRYQEAEIRAHWCDAKALRALEPALSKSLIGALRVPDDAVIYPPNAARFFADQATTFGAQFRTNAAVRSVCAGEVQLQNGERLRCPHIVVAAGVGSTKLLPMARILPRKGHLLITTREVPRITHQLVELGYHHSSSAHDPVSVAFNAQPRASGQILIGSSRQFDDDSSDLVMPVLSRMLHRAAEFLPGLQSWPALRAWCGLRPCTPDNLPYIGAVTDMPGVFIAAGHEGLGITTATGTADLLARMVCGESMPMSLEPFSPQRFATSQEQAKA